MSDPAGRGTTGAMRAVTADQYNRERNLLNQAPHYEPVTDDYPGYNPLRPNNASVTDSFFDLDRNKSTFMDASQMPGGMQNPYAAPPGRVAQEVVETTVTTTTKKAQPNPQTVLAGLDQQVPFGGPPQQ